MNQKIITFHRALFVAILWWTSDPVYSAEPHTAKPNVVVVVCDDLGSGDVQCLNPKRGKIATPNVDRIAAQGMTFTDAHSGSSVCTPTRYGLLTGRYAWRTRLQSGVFGDYPEPLIAPDRLTIGGLLQKQGYLTACIGKWHLGFTLDGEAKVGTKIVGGPITRGFDYYFGYSRSKVIQSLIENDKVIEDSANEQVAQESQEPKTPNKENPDPSRVVREEIEWLNVWVPGNSSKNLPRVLLVGDSITQGYYQDVADRLKGKAVVARLTTSKSAGDPGLLAEVNLVLSQNQFDVIQFNNGLHGWGYTEEEYANGLPDLVDVIRKGAPAAKLVWAATTPLLAGDNKDQIALRI